MFPNIYNLCIHNKSILQVKNSNRGTDADTANTFEQRGTCVGTREKNRRVL